MKSTLGRQGTLAIGVVFSAVACGPGAGSAAQSTEQAPVVWQMQSNFTTGTAYAAMWQSFADELSAKTGGRVKLQIHFNNSLNFPVTQITSLTAKGSLDVGEVDASGATGEFPLMKAPSIPGLIPDDNTLRAKISTAVDPLLNSVLSSTRNQIVLTSCLFDGRSIISSRPLTELNGLAGLKVRSSSGYEASLTASLGATPVTNVGASEYYTALQTGAINALWGIDGQFQQAKLYEVGKYVLDARTGGNYVVLTLNKDSYNRLTDATKKTVMAVAANAGRHCYKVLSQVSASAVTGLKAAGTVVTPLSSSERDKIKELSKAYVADYASKNGAEGQKLLDLISATLKANNS